MAGSKARTVLALLAVNANHVVSTDRLVDELWGEDPPASARNLVQKYVSHLRIALGCPPAGGFLLTTPAGYLLTAAAAQVDANRFHDLVRSADRHLADLVTYDAAPAGATLQSVTGTSDGAGGCQFTLSASLAPGQTIQRVDETSFSASTCQSTVAYTSGTTAATMPADPTEVSDSGVVASTLSGTAPATTALTTRHSAGYMKSWFQDPVHITVNSVQNSTDWRWNGSCVVAPVYGSYHYTWFAGWVKKDNNWQNYYTCTQSTSSSYVHFHDGAFCAFTDTEVYYNRNTVHGKYNGYLTGNVHWSKTGHCSGLLSFHYSLKRTLN